MNPTEVLEKARDVLTARGTVGDPIHHDGVVVVPVAKVLSGGGDGMGQDTAEKEGRSTCRPGHEVVTAFTALIRRRRPETSHRASR